MYGALKAALIQLTKSLAQELGPDNIQVNAIAPGLIKTRFAQVLHETPSIRSAVERATPLGRIGEPGEIAGAALYLASPASDFTTGAVLVVDGGMTLGSFAMPGVAISRWERSSHKRLSISLGYQKAVLSTRST